MRAEIIKLRQRINTTFVYVTHDQTEAMTLADRIVIMKDGFIQQIGTPQEVFDHPINIFVAGFIGTPQMNFIDVTLKKNGNDVYALFGDNKIKVPAEKVMKFKETDIDGKEVLMGIRPENLSDDAEMLQKHMDEVFTAKVEVVELMGSETYLYMSIDGKDENIVARVDPRSVSRQGDTVKIAMEGERLHFFDKETELTLLDR